MIGGDYGEFAPLRTIWFRPRETVRRIIAVNPGLYVVPLVCLAGIGDVLDRASLRNAGDKLPLLAILGLAVVVGPLSGLLGLWIGSHLIRWTGTWIGGTGRREHIKTAIAWSSVPSGFALVLWIPQLILFGSEIFTNETPRLDAQPALFVALILIGLAEMVLGVWAMVLLCNTIAEVQGFRSAWRGLGNLLLAGIVIIVPLVAFLVVVLMLLRG